MKLNAEHCVSLFTALFFFNAAGSFAATPYAKAADKLSKDLVAGDRVSVMPFLYIGAGTGSRGGRVAAERLAAELVRNGKLKVIERALVKEVFAGLKLPAGG
ncbi:MAG: hypothetical protein Q8O90_08310, partial [Elusimicrobiota bacterium]|nr:hypothetical protein [Elusimicrobiota bacterium]